jgi:hypothetical protein
MGKADELRDWYESRPAETVASYLRKLKITEAELKVEAAELEIQLLQLQIERIKKERVQTFDYYIRDADETAADGE